MRSLLVSLRLPLTGTDMFIPTGCIIVVTIIRQDLDDYLFGIIKSLHRMEPGSLHPTEQTVSAGIQQAVLLAHAPKVGMPYQVPER